MGNAGGQSVRQSALPTMRRQVQVVKLSSDFRAATCITELPLELPPPAGTVVVRIIWAGINASDVNFSSGRYMGSKAAAEKLLPFGAGFEAVGTVVALASDVQSLRIHDAVALMMNGSFADYVTVSAKHVFPVPAATAESVALLTSGLTASIALEQAGRMRSGETVLVTAAAGGTGQFVVQLAKLAGNRVIATCGDDEKAALLRSFGADRVINYRKEDVKSVLRREFPQGIDLVYESVGGSMFEIAVNALAKKGRVVIIGMMSQYSSGWKPSQNTGLPEKLLWKSASLSGFFLPDYSRLFKTHLQRLTALQADGRLKVQVEPTQFVGLASISDAVECLQAGKSRGKVVVHIPDAEMSKL